MNDSDSIFDIQERVANCSDQLNKEGYWYFYDDFVKGIERKILNPISIILMNSSLLRKLNRQEKIIYERTTCTVEISIMESFKLLNVEKDILLTSKSLLEMVTELVNTFYLSSPLLKQVFDIICSIISKYKDMSTMSTQSIAEIDQVLNNMNNLIV